MNDSLLVLGSAIINLREHYKNCLIPVTEYTTVVK